MLAFDSGTPAASGLCLGAHSDDIEIGCGGALLHLMRALPGMQVHWVVFSGEGMRAAEARKSAAAFLQGGRGVVTVAVVP